MAPRDKQDESLILEGSRRKKDSARARGEDVPQLVAAQKAGETATQKRKAPSVASSTAASASGSKKNPPNKKQKTSLGMKAAKAGKSVLEMLKRRSKSPPKQAMADKSKPMGDACNPDGTLKDASELDLPYSPSAAAVPPPSSPVPILDLDSDGPDGREDILDNDDEDDGNPKSARLRTNFRKSRIEDEDDASEEEGDGDVDEEDEDVHVDQRGKEGQKKYDEFYKSLGQRKPRKTHKTKDLWAFFEEDTKKIDGAVRAGYYCKICRDDDDVDDRSAFFVGRQVSTQRTHITRFHYAEYARVCDEKKIKKMAAEPAGWGKEKALLKQQSIQGFTQPTSSLPPPKVNKSTMLQYLIELLVDADLSFRFVERPSFRRFVLYLNPKLKDKDIPHKTMVAEAILEKGQHLDTADFNMIQEIPGRITLVYDGWTKTNRKPYTGVGIQWIDGAPNNENDWSINRCLLVFDPSPGRHTGEAIGGELEDVVRKFRFEDKVGWAIGDNLTANDVGVKHLCKNLNADRDEGNKLDPKDMRGRCISHAIHLGPCHFIKALKVPGMNSARQQAQTSSVTVEEVEDDDEALDVPTAMGVEADPNEPDEVLSTSIVDFLPGDVIGKILAFINQLRGASESAREFFAELCRILGITPRRLKLWVRTRWGSLSDCFECVLSLEKAIDRFCANADFEDALPKLKNGKSWSMYRLSSAEWTLLKLSYKVLKVPADMHSQLSADRSPTLHKVYPMLERLMSTWERMAADAEYTPIKHAIDAALANLVKWYKKTDDTSIYFIAHLLDPVWKDRYVKAAWEKEYVQTGMTKLRQVFLKYKSEYEAERIRKALNDNEEEVDSEVESGTDVSTYDAWMDDMIRSSGAGSDDEDDGAEFRDEFEELNRYLGKKNLNRKECTDPVAWWGHQGAEYPVLRRMARDYLAIPASSALIERAFSMSARTDDPRRAGMGDVKFGTIQRLRDAYREGRLEAIREAWMEIDPDFDFSEF